MSEDPEYIIDAEEVTDQRQGRRGDGGVYLVVADGSPESALALRYAAHRAKSNRAHVGIAHIITIDDFQHWHNVEAIMRRELREQAEKFIWNVAREVYEINNQTPALYIGEGDRTDVLIDLINEDHSIRMLVLGGGTSGSDPGPLVSYFTGKGLSKLRVPVAIVPGNLDASQIDEIAH